MKKLILGLALSLSAFSLQADEGMWLLKELNRESAARMKELGFKYPIKNLYDENNASLKDAVVIFGPGCTGVAVSDKGLIFTNHHCGYGAIQKLSSVEHDYLKDGFASQSDEEELRAEGLEIQFLKSTEDITDYILAGLSDSDDESARYNKVDSLSTLYMERYAENEFLRARAVPFYNHNKYYVVVYEVFKDIRLVFTPPSSVGKFGGETDNWMWPRHTGDFSVFRVYANKDNAATDYKADNVPYKPKYSVPVSIKGYKEKDYAMTIGYPGTTKRYMPSWGISQMVESEHKPRIEVRGVKQDIWKKYMNADDAIRIKYANKYAGSSNYWKNAMGMNEAIANLNVIEDKKVLESKFEKWVQSNNDRKTKYGNTLSTLESGYTATMDYTKIRTYFNESFYNGIEIVRFASTIEHVNNLEIEDKADDLKKRMVNIYKDYEITLDKEVMPALLKLYADKVPVEYLPNIYKTIQSEFGNDYHKYTEWFFNNTKVTNLDGALAMVVQDSATISKDPAIILANSLMEIMQDLSDKTKPLTSDIAKGNRLFMAGLMEMNPNKTYSPDANFTQRLSYGSVGGYKPTDAVTYDYYSTSKGVLNKQKPGDPEFNVQDYILDDLKSENYGQYADKDGKMYVNFLSNNDITGGNSGSPVFNNKAELIGLAFDGNWEALSGDIVFNQEVQRCINIDIRYALYIIDKVMKCPRLINELNIAK